MKTIPKVESKPGALMFGVRFLESGAADDAKREVPVLIIKEGMGNKADRHFYSADLLKRVVPMFDGIKAYANHPSKSEENDRPERSVKEIVGYYCDPRIVEAGGKVSIAATLKIIDGPSYDWAWQLVKEAASFSKKFKDKDLVGISINAWGSSHAVEAEDGVLNMVDDLTEVQSADIVTQAGAGGGFRLREAIKALARESNSQEGHHMKDHLTKHGDGLKALHDQIKANPDHAKAYGPAMEALMAHHAEMVKAHEAAPAAGAPADAANDDGVEEKKAEAARQAELSKDFEKMSEAYKAGKLTATEKVLFEALAQERAERKVEAHVSMVKKLIVESGIPEAYSDDLPVLCAGKSEADVKKLIESRKKLVAPLLENRANGSGAGAGGENKPSKLAEKMAAHGVKMATAAK